VNRRTFEKRDSAKGDVFGYDAVDQVAGVNYDATNPAGGSAGAADSVGYAYDATGNEDARHRRRHFRFEMGYDGLNGGRFQRVLP